MTERARGDDEFAVFAPRAGHAAIGIEPTHEFIDGVALVVRQRLAEPDLNTASVRLERQVVDRLREMPFEFLVRGGRRRGADLRSERCNCGLNVAAATS